MSKKFANISDFIGFIPMDGRVIHSETFVKTLLVHSGHIAQPLADQAIHGHVGALLRTTLNQHVTQFLFLSDGKIQF
jgi:hypothetical protein